jgi:exosortase/archaeosortase family protein
MVYLLLKATNSPREKLSVSSPLQGKMIFIIGIPVIISLLPIWVVRGANPDWRLLNVIFYVAVLSFSLACIYDQGGWKKLKTYLFPLLFFIVAIPWPLATDLKLTQWLQAKVSATIVDCLLLMEHKAQLNGTIIDVGVFGQIGVDQACSGINGLQASIVVSLFMGAYFRLPTLHRFMLFFAGLVTALMMNLARAFTMSFIKVKGRGDLLDSPVFSIGNFSAPNLHDLAGWIETGAIFITILLLSKIYSIGTKHSSLQTKNSNWQNLFIPIPSAFAIFTVLFLSATVYASNAHYQAKEKDMIPLPKIVVSLDNEELFTQRQEIPRQVTAQLHYEKANSIQWQDRFRTIPHPYGLDPLINPNDQYWQAFEATWNSGGACTAVLSTHSPDSCIPLTGLIQINPSPGDTPETIKIRVANREIFFETYEFSKNSRKLFVFRCFWPKKILPAQPNLFPRGGYSFDGRINSALEGSRNVGGTMIAIALANVDSPQTALVKFQNLAKRHLNLVAHSDQ